MPVSLQIHSAYTDCTLARKPHRYCVLNGMMLFARLSEAACDEAMIAVSTGDCLASDTSAMNGLLECAPPALFLSL